MRFVWAVLKNENVWKKWKQCYNWCSNVLWSFSEQLFYTQQYISCCYCCFDEKSRKKWNFLSFSRNFLNKACIPLRKQKAASSSSSFFFKIWHWSRVQCMTQNGTKCSSQFISFIHLQIKMKKKVFKEQKEQQQQISRKHMYANGHTYNECTKEGCNARRKKKQLLR